MKAPINTDVLCALGCRCSTHSDWQTARTVWAICPISLGAPLRISGTNAMIAISYADYTFPLLPRENRFALIKLLGFDYVDIGQFERSNGLRPTQMLAEPRKFAQQLKRDIIHDVSSEVAFALNRENCELRDGKM